MTSATVLIHHQNNQRTYCIHLGRGGKSVRISLMNIIHHFLQCFDFDDCCILDWDAVGSSPCWSSTSLYTYHWQSSIHWDSWCLTNHVFSHNRFQYSWSMEMNQSSLQHTLSLNSLCLSVIDEKSYQSRFSRRVYNFHDTWNDTLGVLVIHTVRYTGLPSHHCVRLSASCLSISNDAAIVSLRSEFRGEAGVHQWICQW